MTVTDDEDGASTPSDDRRAERGAPRDPRRDAPHRRRRWTPDRHAHRAESRTSAPRCGGSFDLLRPERVLLVARRRHGRRQHRAQRARARGSSATPPTSIIDGRAAAPASTSAACTASSFQAVALYAGAAAARASGSRYIIAGVVQRLMFRLRAQAEAKLNALPLSYIDHQPRGDLLSRVTNDLDNLAQSLQQTLSQMLTSVLLLIGVAVMMFTISPLLALVALTTVPLSLFGMRTIGGAGPARGSSPQWGSTGALNAQIEETFTGHADREGVRSPAARSRSGSARTNDDALRGVASAPSSCRA